MSTVNATTIYADSTTTNVLSVGNSTSNQTLTTNTTYLQFGANVFVNATTIAVGNTTVNTVINSSGLTTNVITIGGVTYTAPYDGIPNGNVYNYQSFTATGWNVWNKPSATGPNDLVTIALWGGGGGGSANSSATAGGGGGACVIVNLKASQLNATCNVYVAVGGTSRAVGANINATAGENSVFWPNTTFSITAYGGGGAFANATSFAGGSGGGWFAAGGTGSGGAAGGGPLGGGVPGGTSTFGGGGSSNTTVSTNGGPSIYGGGGGASGAGIGGNTIFSGAGGSGTGSGIAGISVYGGRGANGSVDPTTPGGGGCSGKNGANGEVRVWVMKVG